MFQPLEYDVFVSPAMVGMRSKMLHVLLAQLLLTILTFFVAEHLWDTILMVIIVCLGFAGWSHQTHTEYVFFWGLACFLNCIIDIVILLDAFFKGEHQFFSSAESLQHNMAAVVCLMDPISLICGSFLAAHIFMNIPIRQDAGTACVDQPVGGVGTDFATFEWQDTRIEK